MKKILYVVIILVLLIAIASCKKHSNESAVVNSIAIETIDYAGFEKVMEGHKGKVIMINFFGTWCPPCKAETPDFVEIYEKYKDKNFVIIGLAVDRNKADALQFVDDFKITYPVYQATEDLIRYFQVGPIPSTFIVDKDGKVYNYVGQMSRDMVIKAAEMGGK